MMLKDAYIGEKRLALALIEFFGTVSLLPPDPCRVFRTDSGMGVRGSDGVGFDWRVTQLKLGGISNRCG